jgi:predicted PurR-regulated permease PerM
MSDLTIAFITIFGTVASVSCVVAYVFNGTRTLVKEMHATIKEMHTATIEMQKEAEQRHREVTEWFKKSDERADQRHQDVIELLKKGFGIGTT